MLDLIDLIWFDAIHTGSVWALADKFSGDDVDSYPGIALLIQSICIFLGALAMRYGTLGDEGY